MENWIISIRDSCIEHNTKVIRLTLSSEDFLIDWQFSCSNNCEISGKETANENAND